MRYSQIDRRMWNDQKFRDLTPMPPSGQSLWIFLLTNPYVGNIPGLYQAGEAMLSEFLGWPLEQFRERFNELFAKRMVKADWNSRLIWLPNAINYNRPDNPNVVKSWVAPFDELPECPLKEEAKFYLLQHLKEYGEQFVKPFIEGYKKPVRKSSGNGMPNQEQEQEQEQEKNLAEQTPLGVGEPELTKPREVLLSLPLSNGERFEITAELVTKLEQQFPSKPVLVELTKSQAWLEANPKRLKKPAGIRRFMFNWLSRCEDKQNGKPSHPTKKEYRDASDLLADKTRKLAEAKSAR